MAILAITNNTTVQNAVTVDSQITGIDLVRLLQSNPTYTDTGGAGGIGNFAADNSSTLFTASGLSSIPPGSTITSATLYFYAGGGTGTQSVNTRRVLRNINLAQVTWNNWSSGNAWDTGGGLGAADTAASVAANITVSDGSLYYGLDLTAEVQGIVDTTFINYGWLGYSTVQDAATGFRFVNHIADTDGTRPELIVEYTAAPTEDVEISSELRESGVAVSNQNWEVTVYEDAAMTTPIIATATVASVSGVVTVNNDLLGAVANVVWVHVIKSAEVGTDMAGIIFPETVYDAAI